jgi:hypothetical protein
MKKVLIVLASLFLLFPSLAAAKVGVGVGIGKVEVQDELKPGMIYILPSLPVMNTGDEPGEYGVSIEYHEGQEARADMGQKPPTEWFRFEPQSFHLEPGEVQTVEIRLDLPIRAVPGDYFVYLEGHPIKTAESGQTTIGIAAAAKLYFTVLPANIIQGIYYKLASLWNLSSPWSQRVAALLVVVAIAALVKRYFKIQINVAKKKSAKKK